MKNKWSVNFYAWLAHALGVKEQIGHAQQKRIYDAGYTHGRLDAERAIQERMPAIFGERPVYIPVASIQFLGEPPPLVRAIDAGARKAEERQRLFGTQSLPALSNHGVLRKYNEQQRNTGQ